MRKSLILLNSHESQGGAISEVTLNLEQLKETLKAAIIELIRENREEVSELLAEIMEDVAMERAIVEGKIGDPS